MNELPPPAVPAPSPAPGAAPSPPPGAATAQGTPLAPSDRVG
ncbi:hypothetical protein RKE38_05090 [Phycicoccus sp. M110.8]|nr:hypothetical protein [Phycicoccus sp. M110.8]MDU0313054.1 hypothetical protein [Phycicoccus sp. M110.8]